MGAKKSTATGKPRSKRGGARPGAGRKPKSPDDPPSAWRGGRPATRGDVTGRAVHARADTVEEANGWREKARESGMPFELFFALVIREALAKTSAGAWKASKPQTRGSVRGRIVQAVAATEAEAAAWREMGRGVGMPLEAFFAAVLRRDLGTG